MNNISLASYNLHKNEKNLKVYHIKSGEIHAKQLRNTPKTVNFYYSNTCSERLDDAYIDTAINSLKSRLGII